MVAAERSEISRRKYSVSMNNSLLGGFIEHLCNPLARFTEIRFTGQLREQICSLRIFGQDKIEIALKMSSLLKFRLRDHEL